MNDTAKHPGWVGVLLSLFCPGAGQYFAGARARGALWFLALFLGQGLALFLLAEASIPSAVPGLLALGVVFAAWLCMLWDARRPVEKLDWITLPAVLLCGLIVLLLSQWFWTKYCAQFYRVRANNMAPALQVRVSPGTKPSGDIALVQTCAYQLHPVRRGDVVLVVLDLETNRAPIFSMFLRVVGLPGEEIAFTNGQPVINGKVLDQPALFSSLRYSAVATNLPLQISPSPYKIPQDQYFLLGDTSAGSMDTRVLGPAPRSHIRGRVTRVCWPPSRIGSVR